MTREIHLVVGFEDEGRGPPSQGMWALSKSKESGSPLEPQKRKAALPTPRFYSSEIGVRLLTYRTIG